MGSVDAGTRILVYLLGYYFTIYNAISYRNGHHCDPTGIPQIAADTVNRSTPKPAPLFIAMSAQCRSDS